MGIDRKGLLSVWAWTIKNQLSGWGHKRSIGCVVCVDDDNNGI